MYINKVNEFHELFKHPVLDKPTVIDLARSELRLDLIKEEYKELCEAVDNKDLVGIADALGDLQYVLSGAILEFGFKDNFDKIFLEIHRSNLSKLCKTEEEAIGTIQMYLEKDGTIAHFEIEGEYFHVKRTRDNKTLKSINYSPADLKQFI
jgi:predicted HAD superfamily Cof-like phosphohydrolase